MKKTSIAVLAAVLAVGVGLVVAAGPSAQPDARHLTVSAVGEVEAVPDVAHLSLQVSHTAKTVDEAKAAVDRISTRTLEAARKLELEDKDIRASHIRIAPEYEWHEGRRELRGQRVERNIELRLREIERYSALVAALVEAGVTHIQQVHFELSREEELERQALDEAIAIARRKAESMARAAGTGLDRVYSISESSINGGPVPMHARDMAMAAAESGEVPMPLGEQTIRRQVTVVFLLE